MEEYEYLDWVEDNKVKNNEKNKNKPKNEETTIEDEEDDYNKFKVVPMNDCRNQINNDQELNFKISLKIPFEELQIQKELGAGAFGRVQLARLWSTKVAVKQLHKKLDTWTPTIAEDFINEVKIHCSLRHPNVILCLGYSISEDKSLCIVTEYINNDLQTILKHESYPLSARNITIITSGLARGMNYLHSRSPPIIHGDLKPANILIQLPDYGVKITDFGLSIVQSDFKYQVDHDEDDISTIDSCALQKPRSHLTSIQYRAPEANKQSISTKEDVYSYGILYNQLLTREEPWKGKTPAQIWKLVKNGERPQLPKRYPNFIQDIYSHCVDALPENRYSFKQIISVVEASSIDHQLLDVQEAPDLEPINLKMSKEGLTEMFKRYESGLKPNRNTPHMHLHVNIIQSVAERNKQIEVFNSADKLVVKTRSAGLCIGALLIAPQKIGQLSMFLMYKDIASEFETDPIMLESIEILSTMGKNLATSVIGRDAGIVMMDIEKGALDNIQAVQEITYFRKSVDNTQLQEVREQLKQLLNDKARGKGYQGLIIFEEHEEMGRTHLLTFWENKQLLKEMKNTDLWYDAVRIMSPILFALPTFQRCTLDDRSFLSEEWFNFYNESCILTRQIHK